LATVWVGMHLSKTYRGTGERTRLYLSTENVWKVSLHSEIFSNTARVRSDIDFVCLLLKITSRCVCRLKERKIVFGFRQTQEYIKIQQYIKLTSCYLSILSLLYIYKQIVYVLWDPILQKYYLHYVAPCSEFCKDCGQLAETCGQDKREIKYIVVFDGNQKLFYFHFDFVSLLIFLFLFIYNIFSISGFSRLRIMELSVHIRLDSMCKELVLTKFTLIFWLLG